MLKLEKGLISCLTMGKLCSARLRWSTSCGC